MTRVTKEFPQWLHPVTYGAEINPRCVDSTSSYTIAVRIKSYPGYHTNGPVRQARTSCQYYVMD